MEAEISQPHPSADPALRVDVRSALGPVGAWSFALEALPADEEAEALREIEGLGYPAIWFPESLTSREAFSHAAWMLANTERAVIAPGIANIWARDAAAMASGWRMLSDAYPGRFLLGVGVSHAPSVARRGGVYERPVARMREYLETMDRTPSTAPEPVAPPWRMLAALGPRMLELSAERSLGAHTYFVPVEHTAFARQRLGADPVLAVEQAVVLSTDPREARGIAREYAARYLALENYSNNLRRMGRTEADVAGQGSDALIDAVIAWGDEDAIASRVRQHIEAGADHVCIQVLTGDPADVGLDDLARLLPALPARDS